MKRRSDNQAIDRAAGRVVVKHKKPKRKNYRKRAFKSLKEKLKLFVLARGKHRNGGVCEVGVICGGIAPATLPYHVFPAATGNGLKYDVRNLLAACSRCNGGEYFDRQRGTYDRWDKRHQELLGQPLWAELKALQGRRQISTSEANEMAAQLSQLLGVGSEGVGKAA